MDLKEDIDSDKRLLEKEYDKRKEDDKLDDVFIEEETGLKRQIGLVGSIAFLIGAIIGSGIFATPKIVASYSGSSGVMLIIWVAGGVIAILGALVWCELALTFPKLTASEYSYVYEAFGPFPAFVVTYTIILTKSSSCAMIALVAGNYITTAAMGEVNVSYSKGIGCLMIGINLLVNCYSVKLGKGTQIAFTASKLLAIFIIVMTGFVRLGQGYTMNFEDPFNNQSADSISDIGFALYGSLYSYAGWNALGYITAEMANPERDYPLAVMIGIPVVIVCYVLVNVAYLTVKSPLGIIQSSAIAVTIGKELYGVMHWIIPVLVACSCFGASNCSNFGTGRIVYETSNRKHLPKIFGSVHKKRHTPIPGIILTSLISWIVLIPDASNFKTLLGYVQFLAWLRFSLATLGLLWMRKTRPNLKRPFKLFIGIPIMFFIITLFIIVAPFIRYPEKQAIGLIFLLPWILLYFGFVKYQIVPTKVLDKIDTITDKVMSFGNLGIPDFEKVKDFGASINS